MNVAAMEMATTGGSDYARRTVSALGASSDAPWSELGGPPDAALGYVAAFAGVEAALGERSQWTGMAYDFMDRCRGQLFGNVVLAGPTEAYMAGIAPLAGHPDDVDELLDAALRACDMMGSPVLDMYARLYGACGLRLRNRAGDHDRAARLVEESIEMGGRIGAGIARAAAENFPALTG